MKYKLANMVARGGLSMISPGGWRGKLQILIYHRVLKDPDPFRTFEVTQAEFNAQMQSLAQYYNVLSLDKAVDLLNQGRLPAKAVCITFDDGYLDNLECALPILQKFDLPATFFIATGFLDGSNMFNDKVIDAVKACKSDVLDLTEFGLHRFSTASLSEKKRTINDLLTALKYLAFDKRMEVVDSLSTNTSIPLMMQPIQVKQLRQAGMEIGAHTVNHPILAKLSINKAKSEILESKQYLEELLQEPIKFFAYPNGRPQKDYNAKHIEILKKAGFKAAFSTVWQAATSQTDVYQLPRFTPWDKNPNRFLLRLLQYRHKAVKQMEFI